MTEPVYGVTTELVKLALDAATLRQQAIANNIANANTPGYQPLRVSFENQLTALRGKLEAGTGIGAELLAGVAPRLENVPASQGVALDLETAALAENTVRYQALLKALGKQYAILNSVVTGGKH
jgi:flagellar basal-body rod protein FlgB